MSKASVKDITLIETVSSTAPNEHDMYSEGVDTMLKDVLETMMKGKFDSSNVARFSENSKKYALKPNIGEGNCAVLAICDSLNLSHDEAQPIRQEICDIVLACASLERSQQTDNAKVAFKRIFEENFDIFKSVALHFYDESVTNADTNAVTRLNLTGQKEQLIDANSWDHVTEYDLAMCSFKLF